MLVGYVNLRYKKAKTKTMPMAAGAGGAYKTPEKERGNEQKEMMLSCSVLTCITFS